MNAKKEKLGIDIGGTIVNTKVRPRTAFEDALRVIKRLVEERFTPEHTFIVSKVNEDQKLRAMAWLNESEFHYRTGIPADHVEFCPERRDKAPICVRLGITHFIDDRPEVLFHMREIVPQRFLFQGIQKDVEHYCSQNGDIVRVWEWKEIERLLLP